MDALKRSIQRAQLAKPLPSQLRPSHALPVRATPIPESAAADPETLEARVGMLDRKLDQLIRMLKGPGEDHGNKRFLLVSEVRRAVAAYFGINESELDGVGRSAAIARVRQIAYFLCRTHTTRSLIEIGRNFGDRDHTTVMHGARKIAFRRKCDAELDTDLRKLEARLAELLAQRNAA